MNTHKPTEKVAHYQNHTHKKAGLSALPDALQRPHVVMNLGFDLSFS